MEEKQTKQEVFIRYEKDGKVEFYYMDLFWGQVFTRSSGYIAVLPLGIGIDKGICHGRSDNRIEIDPYNCVFHPIRGEMKQTEFGWIDENRSFLNGYCVLVDYTNEDLDKERDTKDLIIFELHKLLAKFGAGSDVLSTTGSYKDTLPDEQVLQMLKELNEHYSDLLVCPDCGTLIDSERHSECCMKNGFPKTNDKFIPQSEYLKK